MDINCDSRVTDSKNNLAEKVINHLNIILNKLHLIEDFCIIPSLTSVDRNTSPVQYNESEKCLGLEAWCVKHVFKHSQVQILKLNKSMPCTSDINKLFGYLNTALLILPEVNTFWNIKRELRSYLNFSDEMQFTKIVLSHKPKSLLTYTYRVWLIHTFVPKNCFDLLKDELKVINKAVVSSTNNYHAWNHRIWCMEHLLPKISNNNDVVVDELNFSYSFVNKHVSEHSGFHYRQYVLKQFKEQFSLSSDQFCMFDNFKFVDYSKHILLGHNIFDDKIVKQVNSYLNLLLYELFEVCKQLNNFYRGHEAVWYHRRFVFYEIIMVLFNLYGVDIVKNEKKCLVHESRLYTNLLSYEQKFLTALKENCDNNMLDLNYANQYQKWLKFRLNLNLNLSVSLCNGEIMFK